MAANQAGDGNDPRESSSRGIDGKGSDSVNALLIESIGVDDELNVKPKKKEKRMVAGHLANNRKNDRQNNSDGKVAQIWEKIDRSSVWMS